MRHFKLEWVQKQRDSYVNRKKRDYFINKTLKARKAKFDRCN